MKTKSNDFGSLKTNQIVSSKKISEEGKALTIAEKLAKLPKIKSKPGFDQRMAAAFAMELEKEVQQRNKSWLKKKKNISLPGIVTNFNKDLS